MTAEQVAQSLGVSAETLVQEVISKQTAWHALCTVMIAIVFVVAFAYWAYLMWKKEDDLAVMIFIVAVIILVPLLVEVHKCTAWRCAPESTAREYIAETYGENARWK